MATTVPTAVPKVEIATDADGENPRINEDKRVLARFMAIVTCLAYLAFTLHMLKTGLSNTSKFVELRAGEATSMLSIHTSAITRHEVFLDRLATLQTWELPKVYYESHEECLTRGIYAANIQLLSDGLKYTDIRQKAIEWTEENCARLLFTPEILHARNGRQIVQDQWAKFKHRCHKYSSSTIIIMKRMANRVRQRMASLRDHHNRLIASRRTHIDRSFTLRDKLDAFRRIHISNHVRETQSSYMKLPAGIAIRCYNSNLCRLVHDDTANTGPDLPATSAEHMVKIVKKILMLLKIVRVLKKLQSIVAAVNFVAMVTSSVFLGIFISIIGPNSVNTDECWHLVHLHLSSLLAYASRFLHHFDCGNSGYIYLFFGIGFLAWSVVHLLAFLTPSSSTPTIYTLVKNMKEPLENQEPALDLPHDLVEELAQDADSSSSSDSDIFTESKSDWDEDDFVDLAEDVDPSFMSLDSDCSEVEV